MKRINVSESEGDVLNWAVAKAQAYSIEWDEIFADFWLEKDQGKFTRLGNYSPSTVWSQGGPIIEQERLIICPDPAQGWGARCFGTLLEFYGPTPLIAAMRCYVNSKLGNEIEVPEKLLK